MIARRHRRGVSLLEMLLVLVISGVAITLTMQVMQQYQRAQSSAIRHERAGREYRLTEAWLREAIQGQVALRDRPFKGGREGFEGTTLAPLLTGPGIPTWQHWQITRDDSGRPVLTLDENGQTSVLAVRPASDLQFEYLDEQGKRHDRWPPARGIALALPAAVVLEITTPDDHTLIVADIRGDHEPNLEPYEPDNEL